MTIQILFYGTVLIACLMLGNEIMNCVRKAVNQMQAAQITLIKEQSHVKNIRKF